ncbi:MAG: hypothetical protein LBI70_02635 [Rickettsiales bacterium]|jgi:type IV secretory pathway VirB2 component (pilin)|nr:hypothetical protein [Rickettsiales bacterium]
MGRISLRFLLHLVVSLALLLPFSSAYCSGDLFQKNQNSSAITLSNEDLLAARRNGIVAALCYVLDIITGKVGRAIGAVAVFAIGWLFILGGVKWTTVFTFTVACSLTFGGIELAHLISHNKYSCSSIDEAREYDKSVIHNLGTCDLKNIEEYRSGQIWYLCSGTSVEDCYFTKITNDTFIDSRDGVNIVALITCQQGYFKADPNAVYRQICKKDSNEIGYFTAYPDGKGEENGKCQMGCGAFDLQEYYSLYRLKPVLKNGAVVILEGGAGASATTYPPGAVLDMDCQEGFAELDSTDRPNSKGAKLICSENGGFQLEGRCSKYCSLGGFESFSTVSQWQHCDSNSANCSNVGENDSLSFIYGEVAKVVSCALDYLPQDEQNKLVIKCDKSGGWEVVRGLSCFKSCKLDSLELGGDTGWFLCNSGDVCSSPIVPSNKNEFKYGEKIAVSGNCRGDYSRVDGSPMKFLCGTNGIWISDSGVRCQTNCNIETTESLFPKGRENTLVWLFYSDEKGEYVVFTDGIIKNGTRIRPKTCENGFNVDSENSAIYVCANGSFNSMGINDDEYCKKGCKFEDLANIKFNDVDYDTSNAVEIWEACSTGLGYGGCVPLGDEENNLIDLRKDSDRSRYALLESEYKIKKCNGNFEKASEDDVLVVKCSANGVWRLITNGWNTCRLKHGCAEFLAEASSVKINMDNINTDVKHTYLQLWGASGGTSACQSLKASLGGYTEGILRLGKNERIFYVTVGLRGERCQDKSVQCGGFNGGGEGGFSSSSTNPELGCAGAGGGGATDIRLVEPSLSRRVAVAGGGGGRSGVAEEIIGSVAFAQYASAGGGSTGFSGSSGSGGGTQESGGMPEAGDEYKKYDSFVNQGVLGQGGHSASFNIETDLWYGAGGGGGGYYGGGGSMLGSGGGGSGYVSSDKLEDAITEINTLDSEEYNDGNGFARICWGDWYDPEEREQINPCLEIGPETYSLCKNGGSNFERIATPLDNCTSGDLRKIIRDNNCVFEESEMEIIPKNYGISMTVRRQCAAGYTLSGGMEGQVEYICGQDKKWSVKSGFCNANPCQNNELLTRDSDSISYNIDTSNLSGITGSGGTKTFNCSSGYSGNVTQYCHLGQWRYSEGACYKNCSDIESMPNGLWSYPEGKNHGAKAVLSCDSGHGFSGSPNVRQCENGTWSVSSVSCIPGCVGLPKLLVGASFNLINQDTIIEHVGNFYDTQGSDSQPFPDNPQNLFSANRSILNFVCDEGYSKFNDESNCGIRNCDSEHWPYYYCNGSSWKQIGVCHKNCAVISNPAKGSWSYTNTQKHGSVATLTCSSGYGITGSSGVRKCVEGNWDSEPSTCNQGCSGLPALVTGGKFTISSGTTIENSGYFYNSGLVVTPTTAMGNSLFTVDSSFLNAECQTGYLESAAGGDCEASACGGKSWNYYYYCKNSAWKRVGTCYKNCTVAVAVANGTWTYTNAQNHGSVATLACSSGYSLLPDTSRRGTCSGGAWTYDTTATCYKNCAAVTAVANGTWTYTNTQKHGSVATLTCSSGYEPTGSTVTKTCSQGTWSTNEVSCREIPCQNSAVTSFKAVATTGATSGGATVEFSCASGYTSYASSGKASLTCSKGAWSLSNTDSQCCENGYVTRTSSGDITIPACVKKITIQAWGSAGGTGSQTDGVTSGRGGYGGYTTGTYSYTSSSAKTLTVTIAGGGAGGLCTAPGYVTARGGAGGNYAAVYSGSTTLVVAGGGGGGNSYNHNGGYGGGGSGRGGSGATNDNCYFSCGGGTTANASNACANCDVNTSSAGTSTNSCGANGSGMNGGNAKGAPNQSVWCGGGGGGGYRGGAAGSSALLHTGGVATLSGERCVSYGGGGGGSGYCNITSCGGSNDANSGVATVIVRWGN